MTIFVLLRLECLFPSFTEKLTLLNHMQRNQCQQGISEPEVQTMSDLRNRTILLKPIGQRHKKEWNIMPTAV